MKHILSITLLILCICILPASAVIQEIMVSGSVSSLHREDNTTIITNPAAGTRVCSYTPMNRPSREEGECLK